MWNESAIKVDTKFRHFKKPSDAAKVWILDRQKLQLFRRFERRV